MPGNDDEIHRHHGYVLLVKGDHNYDHAPFASVNGDEDDNDFAPTT